MRLVCRHRGAGDAEERVLAVVGLDEHGVPVAAPWSPRNRWRVPHWDMERLSPDGPSLELSCPWCGRNARLAQSKVLAAFDAGVEVVDVSLVA